MADDTRRPHGLDDALRDTAPLTVPVYGSTTFVFESADVLDAYNRGERPGYLYSRHGNPTVEAAEALLATLEGGESALVTSSGMAAVATALLGTLRAGDELVCSAALYGGTLHLIDTYFSRFGVQVRRASLEELSTPEATLGPSTKMVWFETPINPTLRCVDIRRVTDACRARGVLSAVDSTFASPVNQRPLALGVDLVMHSATKYLNGHNDVTAGALVGTEAAIAPIRTARKLFGTILDPSAAYLLWRGMKTLEVRVARQNATAERVAQWLKSDARVKQVFYPGLSDSPDYAIARSQMSGFGGMVTFDLAGGEETARRVFDRLTVFRRATSLGGVESLCSLPVMTSHYGLTDAALAEAGVTPGMMRLSIGLESADDLIEDLDTALGSRL